MDAETVVEPGYYWSERLRKLARLQIGEKLPRHVGPWEMVAPEGALSSSEVAREIFRRYPTLDINDFTYTTTSPLPRRLPMGDPPRARVTAGVALFLGGLLCGWFARRALA